MAYWYEFFLTIAMGLIGFYFGRDAKYIQNLISPDNPIWTLFLWIDVVLWIGLGYIAYINHKDERIKVKIRKIRTNMLSISLLIILFFLSAYLSMFLTIVLVSVAYQGLYTLKMDLPSPETTGIVLFLTFSAFVALFLWVFIFIKEKIMRRNS